MQISKYLDNLFKNHNKLLKNIKKRLPELEKLLKNISGLTYEDRIYRYYHNSFKVYFLQESTLEIVKCLKSVSPHKDKNKLDPLFLEIISDGTGRSWNMSHNKEWSKNCRPIVEAFFHSKYFLEMAVKYGKELEKAPNILPSGWAALLELYNSR